MKHQSPTAVLALLWGAIGASGMAWAQEPQQKTSLAQAVPADARLFIEVTDLEGLKASPTGSALIGGLVPLAAPAHYPPPATQPVTAPAEPTTAPATPATAPAATLPAPADAAPTQAEPLVDWRAKVAEVMGLGSEKAVELLLSGRIALAADGWSGIGDAVLLAELDDPEALEAELKGHTATAPAEINKIRCYPLAHDHELCLDGGLAVVGRRSVPSSLYARTMQLWQGQAGVPLADVAEFQERVTALPLDSQIVIYTNPGRSHPEGWRCPWPPGLPPMQSVAVGIQFAPGGITVEASARLASSADEARGYRADDLLKRLPESTLLAWTQWVDLAASFRRFKAESADIARFYAEVMESGLEEGVLERDLLAHLVGDSVWMVTATNARPRDASAADPADKALLLPALALAVPTDDPVAVDRTLQQVAGNLLRLVNQITPREPVEMRVSDSGGAALRSIEIGRLFAARMPGDLLQSLELCWAVAGLKDHDGLPTGESNVKGWLIVGTDADVVRQIAEGQEDFASTQPAPEAEQSEPPTAGFRMVLLAQPRAAGDMVHSWINHASVRHPRMLESEWWQRLRQKHLASGIQLGILTGEPVEGAVEVAQTLPGWPAHERLQQGDHILGVDGTRLDGPGAEESLRSLLAARSEPEKVKLLVRRDEQELAIELPMPDYPAGSAAHPIDLLRQAAELLRIFSSARFTVSQPSPDLLKARLELQPATSP